MPLYLSVYDIMNQDLTYLLVFELPPRRLFDSGGYKICRGTSAALMRAVHLSGQRR